MNVQAIWEDGVFRPAHPLILKRHLVTLTVSDDDLEVPSAQMCSPPVAPPQIPDTVQVRLAAQRARRDEILRRPPASAAPAVLTQEQAQRDRAFAERRAWRHEQGRS
jgi:hypothetical protein